MVIGGSLKPWLATNTNEDRRGEWWMEGGDVDLVREWWIWMGLSSSDSFMETAGNLKCRKALIYIIKYDHQHNLFIFLYV